MKGATKNSERSVNSSIEIIIFMFEQLGQVKSILCLPLSSLNYLLVRLGEMQLAVVIALQLEIRFCTLFALKIVQMKA